MNIFEIYPGKYSVKFEGEKAFIAYLVYDKRYPQYGMSVIEGTSDLKPHHVICNVNNDRNNRIRIFGEYLMCEPNSYSSILR